MVWLVVKINYLSYRYWLLYYCYRLADFSSFSSCQPIVVYLYITIKVGINFQETMTGRNCGWLQSDVKDLCQLNTVKFAKNILQRKIIFLKVGCSLPKAFNSSKLIHMVPVFYLLCMSSLFHRSQYMALRKIGIQLISYEVCVLRKHCRWSTVQTPI